MTGDNLATKIGKYTKYQREKNGYSLNEFSRMTELDTSFLMRLENGVYRSVKIDVLEKLAHGFQMTLEEFSVECKIIERENSVQLPSLEHYLKEKYFLPDAAVEDIKIMIDVLSQKYKNEISEMKKKQKAYQQSQANGKVK